MTFNEREATAVKSPEELERIARARVGSWMGPKNDEPGQERPGQYRLEDVIGFGGMGAVYRAFDYSLSRRVALKVVDPEGLTEYASRFRREAMSIARIDSENIVKVYSFGSHEHELFLAMEILDGEDLETHIERGFSEDELPEALQYAFGFFHGLEEAHVNGITHRAITPSNVFLARKGTKITPKLLDFGIARVDSSEVTVLTQKNALMGTPMYMAPEQMRGAKDVGARADQFSAGAVLFEMLTGKIPYARVPEGATDEPNWTNVLSWRVGELIGGFTSCEVDIPSWLQDKYPQLVEMLGRMLDPDPEKRYPSMMEPLEIIAKLLGREPPEPPAPSVFAEMTRMLPVPAVKAAGNNDATMAEREPANFTLSPVTHNSGVKAGARMRRPPAAAFAVAGIVLVLAAFLGIQLSAPSKARSSHDAGAAAARPQPTTVNTSSDAGSSNDSGLAVDGDGNDASVDYVGDTADAAVESEVDATTEDTRRHGRHRDRDNRRNNSSPPAQTEADRLRAQLVRACCAGQGGGVIAEQLRNDPDHPVRGLTQCQAPDSPCDIVDGDRRPWCRLCQPKCRRGDRRPECSAAR